MVMIKPSQSFIDIILMNFCLWLKNRFQRRVCKDAIQDVFYMLITNRSRLSHVQNIEFYLLQSLKNRLYDLHQSRKN